MQALHVVGWLPPVSLTHVLLLWVGLSLWTDPKFCAHALFEVWVIEKSGMSCEGERLGCIGHVPLVLRVVDLTCSLSLAPRLLRGLCCLPGVSVYLCVCVHTRVHMHAGHGSPLFINVSCSTWLSLASWPPPGC